MKIKEDNAVKKIITNLISLITIISMLSSSAVSAMEKMSNEQLESIFYDWLHNYSLKTYATDDWVYDTTINEIYSSTEVDEEGDPELLAYEMVYEITEYINMVKEIIMDNIPKPPTIFKGFVEKLIIPFDANRNIFFNGYLVLPANLSFRSYSNATCL